MAAKCPACNGGKLDLREFEGVHLTTCDFCGGHFLGPNDFRHLVRYRYNENRGKALKNIADLQMKCLVCKEPMETVNYGSDSGIFIKKCPNCNAVWLAKGQASDIYDYLNSLNKYDKKVLSMRFVLEKKADELNKELSEASKKYRK